MSQLLLRCGAVHVSVSILCVLASLVLPSGLVFSAGCSGQDVRSLSESLYIDGLGRYFKIQVASASVIESNINLDFSISDLRSSVEAGRITLKEGSQILSMPENYKLRGDEALAKFIKHPDSSEGASIRVEMAARIDFHNVRPLRVVSKELGVADEEDRGEKFNNILEYSKGEQARRAASNCTGGVFSDFERSSREVAKLNSMGLGKGWPAVPQALVNKHRLPVSSADPDYSILSKFETAYRNLLQKCTSAAIPPKVAGLIGRLAVGGNVCTAVRLGGKYIATSRHCLFSLDGTPLSVSPLEINFSSPQLNTPVAVCGIVRSRNPNLDLMSKKITANNDYLILEVETSLGPANIKAMDISDVHSGVNLPTELEVVGVWPGSYALGLAGREDLRAYTGGLCAVAGPNSLTGAKCILHKCGTVAGGSGSPLFRRSSLGSGDDAIELLALNHGEADANNSGSECEELPGAEANNSGTILPQEILDELH